MASKYIDMIALMERWLINDKLSNSERDQLLKKLKYFKKNVKNNKKRLTTV